ncbi:DUF4351 domain-containing protein [Leptolyngbyaceae cyanobacterium UHCC 1019]
MAQNPFDQLSKQYLEELLAPLGSVKRQYEIPGESKFVDLWFVPTATLTAQATDLGTLGRITQTMVLLEPFRNAPTRYEVRTCLLKLIWIQEDERRKAEQLGQKLKETDLPQLWILAATVTKPVIGAFKGEVREDWLPGIYFLGEGLKTAIVAIDQLPETEETLLLRILGRDRTQERAIQEVLALPLEHPKRNGILRLLASWKVKIEIDEILDFTNRESMMALSEAFLQWEQQTQEKSRQEEARSLILRLLTRRVGGLSEPMRSQIEQLSVPQLEALGEALLDFSSMADLENWLGENG